MKIKPALIVTVFNEAQTVELLLSSILAQHLKPSEVVIVDGGSSDDTLEVIKNYLGLGNRGQTKIKGQLWEIVRDDIVFKLKVKSGNRSVGRNEAMSLVSQDWVAITDAGCLLDKSWLRELVRAAEAKAKPEVIAGYYAADPLNAFEEAMVPFVLVMPDRVNEADFLPATRSMMIKKTLFEQVGGFDVTLSDNEDYALAKKLKQRGAKFGFAKKAVAVWIPRQTWRQFAKMIYRFARGDAFAGIFRPKVITIYLRYLLMVWLFLESPKFGSVVIFIYLYWAYAKNRRYAPRGWYYLPVLQVVADWSVMVGTLAGLFGRASRLGQGK